MVSNLARFVALDFVSFGEAGRYSFPRGGLVANHSKEYTVLEKQNQAMSMFIWLHCGG